MLNGGQPMKPKRSSIFNRRTTNGGDNNRLSLSAGSFFDASGDTSSILAGNFVLNI